MYIYSFNIINNESNVNIQNNWHPLKILHLPKVFPNMQLRHFSLSLGLLFSSLLSTNFPYFIRKFITM